MQNGESAERRRAIGTIPFDQQLCRRLLPSLDRLRGTEMVMTQQLIANMLGLGSQKRVRPAASG
jgi:hypothetical protein